MIHLFVLLQDVALPTNIWTVGGALALFAGVIAYLFKLYDSSQEKRITEIKTNFEAQLLQVRKDLEEEKIARKALQERINDTLNSQLSKNNATLEKVEDYLLDLKRKT